MYYSPVAIAEDDWPEDDAPSSFRFPPFPPKPTLPGWINSNFTECLHNIFPERNTNNFDSLEECFADTDRNNLTEALTCTYCGFDEEDQDFMYAFCNATGTLQENQVFTCEDYDQLKKSISTKNSLALSETGDDNTINISWTTGEHHLPM